MRKKAPNALVLERTAPDCPTTVPDRLGQGHCRNAAGILRCAVGGLAHGAEGNAMRELCDPLSFSRAKARNLTSIYATVQPRLTSRILARMLCTTVAPANALSGLAAERAVEIIASMGDPRQFEKGLCPLPDHANPRIRSKIALLVVQARSDAPLAGLHIMMEPDARIRDVLVCAA